MFSTKMIQRVPVMARLSTWAGLIATGVSLLGVALSAEAATYYLDPNGNDVSGNGSTNSPWKTLYKAGQAVPANQGHIIHLKAGTYLLDASLNNYGTRAAVWINPGIFIEGENTATDSTRTVILTHQDSSFPGFGINVSTGNNENSPGGIRNLTIDGDNFLGSGGVSTLKISNYTVDNLTIRNMSGSALRFGATGDGSKGADISNFEIKNCKISKTKDGAIMGDSWMGFNIHDNVIDNSDSPNASSTNPSPWADCVRVNYIGNTRIHHNTMHAPSYVNEYLDWQQQPTADTICFFYASGGNEVDNNILSQWVSFVGSEALNGYDKILKFHHNHVYFPYNVTGPGIEIMFNDTDIYENYFENTQIGVLCDPGPTGGNLKNVRVFNNVFRRTFPDPGYDTEAFNIRFAQDPAAGTVLTDNWAIYNNVVDNFKIGFKWGNTGVIKNQYVKNNVFLNNTRIMDWGSPTALLTDSSFTNNIWHYTEGFEYNLPPASSSVVFTNNYPGAKAGLATAGDAGLQLSGAAPNPFYAPLSSSALAVDRGTATISPSVTLSGFSGNAPDIGRYEWTSNGTGPVTGSGSISRDVWTNVGGSTISDIPTGSAPQTSDTLNSMEIPSDAADNYATRLRGYITAPATGNYTFWIAGDDQCELWLSTNDQPGSKTKIAFLYDWATPRQWNKSTTQKSAVVSLTAGQKYYVEVLHKEGNGGDNLAVGWLKPGQSGTAPSEVVPGSQLSPFTSGGGTTPAPLVDRTTNPGGGTITARARINSGENEFKAFDDSTGSKWLDNAGTPSGGNPSWIIYQFANAGYKVEQYTITSANDAPERDPRSWNLQGSNNGSGWTTLNSQSAQTFGNRFEKKTYSFSNSTVYKYYRLQITGNNGSTMTQLSEIELFSR